MEVAVADARSSTAHDACVAGTLSDARAAAVVVSDARADAHAEAHAEARAHERAHERADERVATTASTSASASRAAWNADVDTGATHQAMQRPLRQVSLRPVSAADEASWKRICVDDPSFLAQCEQRSLVSMTFQTVLDGMAASAAMAAASGSPRAAAALLCATLAIVLEEEDGGDEDLETSQPRDKACVLDSTSCASAVDDAECAITKHENEERTGDASARTDGCKGRVIGFADRWTLCDTLGADALYGRRTLMTRVMSAGVRLFKRTSTRSAATAATRQELDDESRPRGREHELERERVACMIGWGLEPRFRGRGFGFAAVSALLECLRKEGVEVVVAIIAPSNVKSIVLAKRLGFRQYKTIRVPRTLLDTKRGIVFARNLKPI